MKKFEQELGTVKQHVMQMGALAARMVALASDALTKSDANIVAQVLAAEEELDRFQITIDSEAVRLITIYAPTARHLRFLLMVARISTELERIGDQAVNNCEYLQMFPSDPPPKAKDDLAKMTAITIEMVHGALEAFEHEDVQRAKQVVTRDDEVDALNRQTFEDLLGDRRGSQDDIKLSMSLILLARSLERIADHAVNVCEEVVFLVEGEDIRHQT
jgi:phosphate transport system protein